MKFDCDQKRRPWGCGVLLPCSLGFTHTERGLHRPASGPGSWGCGEKQEACSCSHGKPHCTLAASPAGTATGTNLFLVFLCVWKNTGPLGECSCRDPSVVNSMKGVTGKKEKPLSRMERDEILLLLHSWWGKAEANGNTFYVLKSTPCLMVTKTLPFLSSSACNPPRGVGEIERGCYL